MFPLSKKFITEKFYFVLPIEKPKVPDRIRQKAERHSLIEKKENHISVVVAKNARLISEAINAHQENDAFTQKTLNLFNTFTWEYSLTNEYFLHERFYTKEYLIANGETDLTEHTRRSIIQKIILKDLEPFYAQLNSLLQVSLSVPVPHTTLFTWADHEQFARIGIGINSLKEFDENTRERL